MELRKQIRRWGVLLPALIVAFFPIPAWTASPVPDRPVTLKDFVHARELETKIEGAFCKFPLSPEVYRGLSQSQNRDLAVFNSNGETVPFVVLPVSPIYDISMSQSDLTVPFFELPPEENAPVSSGVAPVDIYVRTGTDGQVVEIRGNTPRGEARDRRYLLDFSSVIAGENADSHHLVLFVPEDMKLNAEIDVFGSANLRDWSPVLRSVPLLQLQNRDARLASNVIDLPDAPQRYLLLKIRGLDSTFVLKDVRYSFKAQSSLIRDEREIFDGTPTADRRAVEYDLGGAFPVSKINFVLQEPGLYRVHCSSRADANAPWRPAGPMELSMIRESATSVRANASINIDTREDRYWRVEFESAFSGPPPKLKINWRPFEVYFLAQGRGPWILAFGSSRKGLNLQNSSLAQDRQLRTSATEVGIGVPLDPDKNLSLAPGGERAGQERFGGVDWQRRLVWGLLALGALLLSAMALKLLKSGSTNTKR